MDTTGDTLDDYPGTMIPATTEDFAVLKFLGHKMGMKVTLDSGGSFFVADKRWINVDAKTKNKNGFVSVSTLTDEYLHAWNQINGRGRYLKGNAASMHLRLGADAERYGTRMLSWNSNCGFHKLEALNFLIGSDQVPSFVWRTPIEALRKFADSWIKNFQF